MSGPILRRDGRWAMARSSATTTPPLPATRAAWGASTVRAIICWWRATARGYAWQPDMTQRPDAGSPGLMAAASCRSVPGAARWADQTGDGGATAADTAG